MGSRWLAGSGELCLPLSLDHRIRQARDSADVYRLHAVDLITMAAMGAVGLGVYEANPGELILSGQAEQAGADDDKPPQDRSLCSTLMGPSPTPSTYSASVFT